MLPRRNQIQFYYILYLRNYPLYQCDNEKSFSLHRLHNPIKLQYVIYVLLSISSEPFDELGISNIRLKNIQKE